MTSEKIDESESSLNFHLPQQIYRQKKETYQQNIDQLEKTIQKIVHGRLVSVLIILVMSYLVLAKHYFSPYWVALPIVLFCGLVIWHGYMRRQLQNYQQILAYYTKGLSRLSDNWTGQGQSGDCYRDPNHPYAEDLDIFGRGSLFELVCAAPTQLGRDTLANWLNSGSNVDTILERQEGTKELSQELEFIERLALLEAESNDEFCRQRPKQFLHMDLPILDLMRLSFALALGLTGIVAIILWLMGFSATLLTMVLIAALIFYRVFFSNIFQVANAVDEACSGLNTVVKALSLIENKGFNSPLLKAWRKSLDTNDCTPSWQIHYLYKQSQALNNCLRNQLAAPIALLLGLPVLFLYRINAWRSAVGVRTNQWLDVLGNFEAMVSLARYHFEHPHDVFPEFVDEKINAQLVARQLGHPLMPTQQCVTNDVRLDQNQRLLIVSGSNMSGKSTFLRSIGINVVLAQCGAPVRASSLMLSHFSIGTTMRIRDSLQQGISHFYAEISRLRKILSLAKEDPPLLFLLDEILHGTNSHDRLIGAEWLIKQLLNSQAVGLITTHDLALTAIADRTNDLAVNMHFKDDYKNGEMHFDYTLRLGVVEKGNALALMKDIGLDVDG